MEMFMEGRVACWSTYSEQDCLTFIKAVRWQGVVTCPYCNSPRCTTRFKEDRYHCNRCNTTFSVTTGTVFHQTHLPMRKWFIAISLLISASAPLSVRQLARELEVDKNTAAFLLSRIYAAFTNPKDRALLEAIAADRHTVNPQGVKQ